MHSVITQTNAKCLFYFGLRIAIRIQIQVTFFRFQNHSTLLSTGFYLEKINRKLAKRTYLMLFVSACCEILILAKMHWFLLVLKSKIWGGGCGRGCHARGGYHVKRGWGHVEGGLSCECVPRPPFFILLTTRITRKNASRQYKCKHTKK